jgi:hypothetical protein
MPSTNGRSEHNEEEDLLELLEEDTLETELTEETYQELVELEGSVVVGLSFWDSSLADELEEEPVETSARQLLDLDLFLEDNTTLELYGALLYLDPESEPLVGMPAMEKALVAMVDRESVLSEVAETEDGAPVFVFAAGKHVTLVITAGAWTIGEWEELPETEE